MVQICNLNDNNLEQIAERILPYFEVVNNLRLRDNRGYLVPIVGLPGTGKTKIFHALQTLKDYYFMDIGEYNSGSILQAEKPELYITSLLDVISLVGDDRIDGFFGKDIFVDSLKFLLYSSIDNENKGLRKGGISNAALDTFNKLATVCRLNRINIFYTISPNSADLATIREIITLIASSSDLIFTISVKGILYSNIEDNYSRATIIELINSVASDFSYAV